MCLYRPNIWWEGEFEWPKTLQGPQLENCRDYLNHHVLFGRVSRKILHAHPKTRLELRMGLASMLRWNWKRAFWQQTLKMVLVQTGIQIKNQNLTASIRNLIMDRVWIFHQDNNPKQTWVAEHKTKLLLVIPVLWPEPCRRWVRWTEEKKLWIWRSGVILDEGMVSDLVSGVL